MKRPKRDPVREDRIQNEAIVDASPDEQAMSWYYYLESKISFPFQATCLATKVVSPFRKGETVEVLRMAPDEVCEHDMLVLVRWQGRTMAAPLRSRSVVEVQRAAPPRGDRRSHKPIRIARRALDSGSFNQGARRAPLGLRRAWPLPRLPPGRAERVVFGRHRVLQHQRVGRGR